MHHCFSHSLSLSHFLFLYLFEFVKVNLCSVCIIFKYGGNKDNKLMSYCKQYESPLPDEDSTLCIVCAFLDKNSNALHTFWIQFY